MEERFSREKLEGIFKLAEFNFRKDDRSLLVAKLSEKLLCHALARQLQTALNYMGYPDYRVEVPDFDGEIGFGLTVHAGVGTAEPGIAIPEETEKPEKLMVIMLRRWTLKNPLKRACREKLMELTKDYTMGMFYVVNFAEQSVSVEFYADGERCDEGERLLFENMEL